MTKILLVEDNEMNRDMLSRRLIKKGFDVVMAVDGQIGLDMATSENPDLILLDMSLPVMDGWTVAGHLKSDDQLKSIPIIALTAHATSAIPNPLNSSGSSRRLPIFLVKVKKSESR